MKMTLKNRSVLPLSRPVPKKKPLPKPALADTIIGFSESMPELSIRVAEKALAVPAPQQEAEEETDSEYEVITVLEKSKILFVQRKRSKPTLST